jgi:hypothetical protein
MRSKSVKPSAYPALPFHAIRFLIFLSSAVVAIILAVFIYHLHADGYKLPFAFLIVSPSNPNTSVPKLTKNHSFSSHPFSPSSMSSSHPWSTAPAASLQNSP